MTFSFDYAKNKTYLILTILLLFSLGIKLYYADKYPVFEDEAISVLAAEGITKHGIPILPSGFLYARDLLHQYLLAIPVAIFGTGEVSIRALSIFFSLVTIFIVYLMVSRLSSTWGGIIAASVLAFSRIEMDYALSARMYMQYQMFTVLTAYFFIRGFIEESRAYQWLSIFAIIGMLLSRKLGILDLGVMTLYLLVQSRGLILRNPFILKSAFFITPVLYFVWFYKFQNQMPSITGHSWDTGGVFTFAKFNYNSLTYYIMHLFSAGFPWSFPIFLIGLVWTIWKRDRVLTFLYLLVILPFIIVTFFERKHPNYLINIFPIYIGIVCIILVSFGRVLKERLHPGYILNNKETSTESCPKNRTVPAWLICMSGIILITGYAFIMITYHNPAFGFKSSRPDERPAHLFVKREILPGDAVITSNPWVTYYYLKDFDFFIRQKFYKEQGWGEFPVERDEYYGKPIIDTLPELEEILHDPSLSRVWLILDGKFFMATGKKIIAHIPKNFHLVYGKNPRGSVLIGLHEKSENL